MAESIDYTNNEITRPLLYLVFKEGKNLPLGLLRTGKSVGSAKLKMKDGKTKEVYNNFLPTPEEVDAMQAEIVAGNAVLMLGETVTAELE